SLESCCVHVVAPPSHRFFPYTTLFRSWGGVHQQQAHCCDGGDGPTEPVQVVAASCECRGARDHEQCGAGGGEGQQAEGCGGDQVGLVEEQGHDRSAHEVGGHPAHSTDRDDRQRGSGRGAQHL